MTIKPGFIHIVYFWLRENVGSKDENGKHERSKDAELLAEGARRHLSDIPGVLRIQVGFPAGTPREVVDNSYGVALMLEFAGMADHDLYQNHPDHHRFIEECRELWSKVQIYDTLV